jgi:peptidoglycan/LPS O-acetylase OafA/YrhL
LQVLRAVAAGLVVIQHAVYYASVATGADITSFLRLSFGGLGVYIFFVISGVVMAITGGSDAGRFLLRRAKRIYPPFIAALVLGFLITRTSFSWHWSFLLIPTGAVSNAPMIPYWTLIYEMVFYVIIAGMIFAAMSDRARVALLAVWLLAIGLYSRFGTDIPPGTPNAWQILLSPANVHFIAGYALGLSILRHRSFPIACIAVLSGLLAVLVPGAAFNAVLPYAVLGAGLCYLAIAADVTWPRWAIVLGDWSYGIYLLHLPAIYAVYVVMKDSGQSLPVMIALLLLAGSVSGLLFGWAEHAGYRRWLTSSRRPLQEVAP